MRAGQKRCRWCHKTRPRKHLTETAVGPVCSDCMHILPKRLRLTTGGDDK